MTQKEKELLSKDLCGRLPYGVKCTTKLTGYNDVYAVQGVYEDNVFIDCPVYGEGDDEWMIESIIPFLRPMSSMTEEEYTEYRRIQGRNCDYSEATICVRKNLYTRTFYDDNESIKITVYYPNPVIRDWLDAHHFDYRGLIERGLALEAPEGMYNTKNE